MKTIDFNLNHYFLVKLTDLGYERLVKIHNDLAVYFPSTKKVDIDYYKSKADEKGFTKFQAHDFIDKFGDLSSDLIKYCDINIKVQL